MKILPARTLRGTVIVPGDKSISHRAAIIAAMADGVSTITNFSTAADCVSTLNCLRQLGTRIETDGTTVRVEGSGRFTQPDRPLECGNSGTTARLLAGVLAGQPFDSVLTGDESLSSRPMRRIVEPLRAMGASLRDTGGRLPLYIEGGQALYGIEYELPVASAQVKSCLLLAGLNAAGTTTIVEPQQTRDHTERMLGLFGANVAVNGTRNTVCGDTAIGPRDIAVPGDISSAAYFFAAAACLEGSDLTVAEVGLNPTRTAFIDLLRSLGADIEIGDVINVCNEPRGSVRVRCRVDRARRLLVDAGAVAGLIDEIPLLAVVGTQIDGLEVRGAAELRHKETDRIVATVENLRRMGAAVEEFEDGFGVRRSNLKGAAIDSRGDHRIAMTFAVAGLLAEGATDIGGPECVSVSFPKFFDTLLSAVAHDGTV